MKIIAKLNKIALLAIIAVATFSCNSDDEPIVNPTPVDNSIAGIASRNADLSVLVKALTKTDLVATMAGPGSFTVFAPTNAAFAEINITAASIDALTPAQIPGFKQIVLNHVSAGAKTATQLVDKSYIKTLATFSTTTSNISMFVDKSNGIKLNGLATVSTTASNILATNGVIHVVDKVLVLPTIVSHAVANPALDILQAVVTSTTGAFGDQSAVLGVLNGATAAAPLTVFAPTNAAFETATGTGGFANLATPAQVSNVLKYHVVAGANVLAGSLTEGQVVTTALSQTFSITLVGGAQITDKSTPTGAIKAKIIITDIQASNGVVHAVDKVLQPTL